LTSLTTDAQTKTVTLLGTIRGEHAIVTLEKTAFPLDNSRLFDDLLVQDVKNLDTNDIYSWNLATVHQDLDSAPGAKVSLVYPATETHIKKHRKQDRSIVVETPQMYTDIVLPYIETQKGDRIQWVMNILHHGAEADRVVFRDDDPITGFVLLPNMCVSLRALQHSDLTAGSGIDEQWKLFIWLQLCSATTWDQFVI
jgi:m7GpppX diphosphatase